MKSRVCQILIALGVLAATAPLATLHAQVQLKVGDLKLSKVALEVQKTPDFQAGNVKGKNIPNPRDWLEVEYEFEVAGDPKEVIKELMFRNYVAFTSPTAPKGVAIVSGDVKHVNVVPGEKYFTVSYVSPSTIGEVTGEYRNFQVSGVVAAGVEVFYNGVIVGGESTFSGSKAKFWEALSPQPGVLSKLDTPFALLWIDRYAEFDRSGKP
jgi:hypothetical protein